MCEANYIYRYVIQIHLSLATCMTLVRSTVCAYLADICGFCCCDQCCIWALLVNIVFKRIDKLCVTISILVIKRQNYTDHSHDGAIVEILLLIGVKNSGLPNYNRNLCSVIELVDEEILSILSRTLVVLETVKW